MTGNLNFPDLFKSMTFWTDASLSALDTALSSTQNISDGVDRLARAGARAEAIDQAPGARRVAGKGAAWPAAFGWTPAMQMQAQMQRSTFDLMTQAWQQWMTTLGTLASLGAGRSFKDTVEHQNPWLNALRASLASEADTGAARTASAGPSRRQGGNDRERHAEPSAMEHAAATTEPKRRNRGSRAKSKDASRSRGSSRGQR